MEDFVRKSLLMDFYGELLTEHRRRIYQEVVFDDFSISEIARDEGISRQGVHDLIKRTEQTLEDYEARLHLVERHLAIRRAIEQICALSAEEAANDRIRQIHEIAEQIRKEL